MPFSELLNTHWEAVLVLFAAVFLVPAGLRILGLSKVRRYWLAAAGLATGYLLFPHPLAGIFALPYLILAIWLGLAEGLTLLTYKPLTLPEVLRVFALAWVSW